MFARQMPATMTRTTTAAMEPSMAPSCTLERPCLPPLLAGTTRDVGAGLDEEEEEDEVDGVEPSVISVTSVVAGRVRVCVKMRGSWRATCVTRLPAPGGDKIMFQTMSEQTLSNMMMPPEKPLVDENARGG